MRTILPETYQSQVQHIQESPKFLPQPGGSRQPAPFPGYTVITPPGGDDHQNAKLYDRLEKYQARILQHLGSDLLVPVPASSFHLTLADLIWDGAFRHAAEKPGFEAQLQQSIGQSFQQAKPLSEGTPIRFQALGLMVMTRAIALCLVPPEEVGYERLIKFRRNVYQNHDLIAIGIEQQYYFTPHITLGYFGDLTPELNREQLAAAFNELNQQWLEEESHQEFWVHRAELRKFENMTAYHREADWPTLEF